MNSIIKNVEYVSNNEYIIGLNMKNSIMKRLLKENNLKDVKSCKLEHLKYDRGEYLIINVFFNNDYQTAIRIYKKDYINFIEEVEKIS